MEKRNCQNCKNDFTIEAEDFNFYEKIKVPPPTFCPECRMIRRMIWRNCRSLYKRTCGLCKKNIVSMYSEEKQETVYCLECWNGDERNPLLQSRDYDFSVTFFEQLRNLLKESPLIFIHHISNIVRSEFTNYSKEVKDCYLSYSVVDCENIMYSEIVDKSKNNLDCYAVQKVENCSYNIDCEGNYNTHYAIVSRNCIDSYFIYDCVNCQNCCLSSGLRNQQYFFENIKYKKEEYDLKVLALKLDTYSGFINSKENFDDMLKNKAIHRFAQIYNSHNSTGDYIGNSKNIIDSFDVQNSENLRYCIRSLLNAKDCYDNQGVASGELIYESMASSFMTYKDYFTFICVGSKECEYSFMCKNCSNCFGCVGLKNVQYFIFNKGYEQEKYFELVEKIKKHMNDMPYVDDKGRVFKYGEFFPYDMCPFGYNETNAQEYFPITKEDSLKNGYPWKDREKRNYNTTINSKDLPNSILDVKDDILNETIACLNNGNALFQCTGAYRIMPNELTFYRQKSLPLPRYCPNCRHYERLKYRNTMKLYTRECMNKDCKNTFETTYAPEKPEIIYCESCYNKEIY